MPPFDDVPGVDLTGSELLVVNAASTGGPLSYDRGDIVIVRPAGWPWGRLEDPEKRQQAFEVGIAAADPPDKFVLLKIPGRAFKQAMELDRAWQRTELLGEDNQPNVVTESKSLRRVDLDNLPPHVQSDLSGTGKATVGWGAASTGHIIRKDNGKAVADLGAV